ELADNRNEAQKRPRAETPPAERQRDDEEGLPARAAQVGRGFKKTFIELFETRIERQDHERQIGGDEPDINGGIGREPWCRVVDQAEPSQRLIEQAVALEDIDPGKDPDQE